ncbi:MAG: preprotein translocase subunit SecA [Bdellovibrionales bacterium]|nr:preprotein translocase subunit SecA [Bdellovibrionales bacterium]
MVTSLLTRIFGTQHEREIKQLRPIVNAVNDVEPQFAQMSDSELQAQTGLMKEQIEKGKNPDDLLIPAFAVCREASKRVLKMRHYDVQIIGGWALYQGRIAEMKTGEGKTLVATLPVYLEALRGKGVHVVTVNDYLAKRDTEWMGQVYNFLGLSTGTIIHDLGDKERKEAYRKDITYGTNNEFGFDYLRDNMKFNAEDCVQRELNYAIVDECDSILVDEARTPLIISGPKDESIGKYQEINRIIPSLERDKHFTMEEKSKTVSLTEEGNLKVEELLKIKNLYDISNISRLHHIYQALKAHHLYKRDVDYMVKNNEIMIVDEFTGRLMPGRRWSEGLHQAIEAKEGVKIRKENQTLATITFQNYFRQYNKLAGMTGTAETEAVEFKKIYNLDVMVIPTNKPIQRKDLEDVIYKTEKVKFNNIIEDIKDCQKRGQPVLVGTISIEKSEEISQVLKQSKVPHNVLNARHHEREAEIVAQAGRKGAITIATNMAGRGTDIVLGGNAEFLAQAEAKSKDVPKETLEKYQKICEAEKKDVLTAGGLYIVGTERHEARRIDNQLRGRSGRQGDPGASRFYLSLEDNLMRIFGGERMTKIMNTLRIPEDEAITDRMVSRAVASAQRKVEGHNFSIRKHLLDYDDVMNQQRTAIYTLRRKILRVESLERMILDYLSDVTSDLLDSFVNENVKKELWDLKNLSQSLLKSFGISLEFSNADSADVITQQVQEGVKQAYDRKKEELGRHFSSVVQFILLQTIDSLWKEHLENIDYLKEGINLRGYAQKDPLIEYKKEAFSLFETVNQQIANECIEKLFKIQISESTNYDISPHYNEEQLDYSDGDSPDNNWQNLQMAREEALRKQRALSYNQGNTSEERSQLNRAQRRMQSKKKRKIKI